MARVLHAVRDAASGQASQPVERERRSGAVAGQPLAPEVVARGDAHASMQIEALVLGGEAHLAGSALLRVVGAVVLVGREPGERPALHGDRGARFEGAGLGRLVRIGPRLAGRRRSRGVRRGVSSVCAETALSGTGPPTDCGQGWRSGPAARGRARVVARFRDPWGRMGPVRGHRVALDMPWAPRGVSART